MTHAERQDVVDVDRQQIAAVYAKALLGAHEQSGQVESLVAELDSLVADVLDKFPQFEQALASAFIAGDEKVRTLERTLGGQASPEMMVFLKVLARHGRLDCLRAIRREARAQFNILRSRIEVEVRVATKIDESLRQEIRTRLRGKLQGEPVLNVIEDPSLIAGFRIRIGDTVYDSSVLTQLDRARSEMIERSVELIETRRRELVG